MSKFKYTEILNNVIQYYNNNVDSTLNNNNINIINYEEIIKSLSNYKLLYNTDKSIRTPIYINEAIASDTVSNTINNINSANAINTKIATNIPFNTQVSNNIIKFKSGLAASGNFIVKEIIPAIGAVSVGIMLGKTIDKTLYELNPNFWDAHDMSSINPDTWNTITMDDESLNAKVFNLIFGLNEETIQPYMDENAVAYLTKYMLEKGVFNETGLITPAYITSGMFTYKSYAPDATSLYNYVYNTSPLSYDIDATVSAEINNFLYKYNNYPCNITYYSSVDAAFGGWSPITIHVFNLETNNEYGLNRFVIGSSLMTKGSKESNSNSMHIYDVDISENIRQTIGFIGENLSGNTFSISNINADYTESIKGIGTQKDADVPILNADMSIEEILQELQTQLSDTWTKAITQTVVQENGIEREYVYVPISLSTATDFTDEKPISGELSQNELIYVDNISKTLLDLITDIITTPITNGDSNGKGSTPLVNISVGTASALWSIYNPTLEQVKSLGGWLWSSTFADQILKVLADPMQAIISLHKVFGTPSISGTGEIKVGYLSSGISGVNIVDNQYTHINCGSVNLYEYFGNVFDYPPYTDIQIYLPFIGIVPLRVEDVLRSTITVTYDIDVLTGACLANINVLRDNAGGILYTYNGNCAVQYPLSSGSYLGLSSALLGLIGGAFKAGVAGAVVGGVMGAMNGKGTEITRSGNLSGNAGAMGIKKPYVIISRPITAMATDYQKYIGIPTNSLARIGDCKGFISCKEVFIKSGTFESGKKQNLTAEQANEIETLLKNGVIIN